MISTNSEFLMEVTDKTKADVKVAVFSDDSNHWHRLNVQ